MLLRHSEVLRLKIRLAESKEGYHGGAQQERGDHQRTDAAQVSQESQDNGAGCNACSHNCVLLQNKSAGTSPPPKTSKLIDTSSLRHGIPEAGAAGQVPRVDAA